MATSSYSVFSRGGDTSCQSLQKVDFYIVNQKWHIDIADLAFVTDFKISKITYYQVF